MNATAGALPEYLVECRDLSVALGGKRVLDIPLIGVRQGEVLAIIGPNGSGKTTLVLTMALLQKPSVGVVLYRGNSSGTAAEQLRLRRRFAMVFQEALLLSGTVWDNVTLGLRLRGVEKEELGLRARNWLARFGISELAGRQAKTLSGGEAQRASLARAFALHPEVLFLDEPFAALDSPTRQSLLQDLQSVLGETKTTTVIVTHDRNEALMLADRVVLVMKGQVRQVGAPRDVFSSPADEEVAGFVGVENIWHGVVSSQDKGVATVRLGEQQIDSVSDLPAASIVTACLRPEEVTIVVARPQPAHSSARNQLLGRIVQLLHLGSQVRITVDCGFPITALITLRSYEELELGVGRDIAISFKASSVHLLPSRKMPVQ